MKGFPKTIATGVDLHNCLELVRLGYLESGDLKTEVAAIEEREFTSIPIMELSKDRKTITVRACADLAAGVSVDEAQKIKISKVVEMAIEEPAEILTPGKGGGGKELQTDPELLQPTKPGHEMGAPAEMIRTGGETEPQAVVTLTLSAALPDGTTTLRVPAEISPLDVLNISRKEFDAIKEVLNSYA